MSSISGSVVNTTFAYDANGNQTGGNGLTLTYASFNKPATIARGSALIAFAHDSEHQRYKQMNPTGETLYLAGSGVMAERLLGAGGVVQWTNYLAAGGEMIGMRVDRSDASTYTRYFHKDHLGSIATITDAAGAVVERLSYDAWGKRRFPNGQDDPSGSVASQTTRGFTGHEQLADVGLIHMNGRVYDPLLGRFGTPDPTTENPFSTQGWNRYSYVGNSPLNFTDPSGYCFMGCIWQKPFKALGKLFRNVPILGQILTVAAGLICGPVCSSITSAVVTGLASGSLGLALKAGFISMATATAFAAIGDLTGSLGLDGIMDADLGGHGRLELLSDAHLFNIAGHAAVGCASSVASGGKCGPGALSGAVGSFSTSLTNNLSFEAGLVVTTTAGGLASVAGGGKFGNGAVTAAFGYLYNRYLQRMSGIPAQSGVKPYFDDTIVDKVKGFFDDLLSLGVPVEMTSGFRTTAGQGQVNGAYGVQAAPGNSLHEAGYAFDINYANLATEQQELARSIATKYGFSWGGSFDDPIHFYTDPWPGNNSRRQSDIITKQQQYQSSDRSGGWMTWTE